MATKITKEYWDTQFNLLYKKYKYPFLKFTSKELAKKLGIKPSYFNLLTYERHYNTKHDYDLLFQDYDPEKYTLQYIKSVTNIKKSLDNLRKYLRKYHPDIKTKDYYKDISEDTKQMIAEMYEEYEFPILKKGYRWIAEYLGYSYNNIHKILKRYNRTKEKEYRSLFKRYKPHLWSAKELANISGTSPSTITFQLRKLYKKKTDINIEQAGKKQIYSAKSMLKANSRFGLVNDLKKINSNEFYIWVKNKFLQEGKFTIAEARMQGVKKVGIFMQIIKKKYKLKYYYDHSTATYYQGEKSDV